MKRLLTFLFSMLPVAAWAASPSFDSFRGTNSGFIVNQPYIYVANTNTGGTNVTINGDVIYTNTTISYFITTNNYNGATINITNSTVTITNSTVTINGTNVPTINPTIGRLPFKFSDFQFGDSALYYIDPNTVGTTELDTDVLKLGFPNVPTTLFAGENDIDVTDHSVLVCASADPSAQLRLNSGNGNVTMMLVYHAGTTAFSLLNGDSLWDGSGGVLYLSGGDWHPTGDGEAMLMFKTPIGWSEANRFTANTNVITAQLWQFAGGYLQPTDLTQPLFLTNSVTWGPGTTNVFVRNGTELRWEAGANGSAYPGFQVTNITDSTEARFTAGGNNAEIYGTAGVGMIDGIGSGNELRWFSHEFGSPGDTHVLFGSDVSGFFHPLYQVNQFTNHIFGFLSGTNYTRITISMPNSTNGFGDIATEAAGSAGDPRPLRFLIGSDQVGIPYNGDTANTSYGFRALNAAIVGSVNNEGFGYNALLNLTTGTENAAFGLGALLTAATANYNSAFGNSSLKVNTGDFDTAIGSSAGSTNSSGSGNVYVGYNANPNSGSDTDTIVIGKDAVGMGSNTATIGDANVTVIWLAGAVGWFQGNNSPEGSITAPVGSLYSRKNGGAGTSFYVKESGSGNTGWVGK